MENTPPPQPEEEDFLLKLYGPDAPKRKPYYSSRMKGFWSARALFFKHPLRFFAIIFIPTVLVTTPFYEFFAYSSDKYTNLPDFIKGYGILFFAVCSLYMAALMFIAGLTCLAAQQVVNYEVPRISQILPEALKRFPVIWLNSCVLLVAVFAILFVGFLIIGDIIFIIWPFLLLYLILRWFVIAPVCMLEKHRPIANLRRSSKLISGSKRHILSSYWLWDSYMAIPMIGLAPVTLLADKSRRALVFGICSTPTMLIICLCVATVYFNLRNLKGELSCLSDAEPPSDLPTWNELKFRGENHALRPTKPDEPTTPFDPYP